jgi:potassium-transporting ATPase potassium-binding subunit
MGYLWTIVAMVVLLAIAWRFLGSYMAAVYEGRVRWLRWLEHPIYRLLGTEPEAEQTSARCPRR